MTRDFAFPRRLRIVRENDFKKAFAEGGRARGGALVVVVRENGLPETRLGLSVGKSIWKSAVRRNRVRRVFREAFRLNRRDLPPGLDVVMIAAVPKLEPELAVVGRELVELVAKAVRKQRARRAAP
jgi:ribonuclease P protein component